VKDEGKEETRVQIVTCSIRAAALFFFFYFEHLHIQNVSKVRIQLLI